MMHTCGFADFEIAVRDGKYGVAEKESGKPLISFEYDNIFHANAYSSVLILCRDGKVGAMGLDGGKENGFCPIAPCRYDAFAWCSGDLLFRTAEECCCYFDRTKQVRTFSEVCLYGNYLYGFGAEGCSLMRSGTGEVLWSMSGEEIGRELPCGVPRLAYMGESGNLPVFYDTVNGGCILPQTAYYLAYCRDLPHVIKPVIVNGRNVVNIVGGPDGLDAVEFDGRCFHAPVPCRYEEVAVELRLRLRRGGHTEERILQIPQGRVTTGTFFDFADWGE